MKIKILVLLSCFLFNWQLSFAQNNENTHKEKSNFLNLFDLETEMQIKNLPELFKGHSAAYVKHFVKIVYDTEEKGKDFKIVKRLSRKLLFKVIDEKGIELVNKFHLPVGQDMQYTGVMAQCINSKGERKIIPGSGIITQKDEKGNEEIFIAMEGVDVGSEVELIYTISNYVNQTEGRFDFSSSIPTMDAAFQLEVPATLVFELKGYHGFETLYNENISYASGAKGILYTAVEKNIPGLKEEDYSNPLLIQPAVAHRLSYTSKDASAKRINTWNSLASNLHAIYYQFDKKKEAKAIEKFLDENKISKSLSVRDRIIKIEQAIKSKIVLNDELETEENLSTILKNKTANSRNITRLYCSAFQLMEIPFELGLSSSRYEYQLDEKFELWGQMDYFLFRFPGIDGFLTPEDVTTRFPLVAMAVYGNKALFCKIDKLGSLEDVSADFFEIPTRSSTDNRYEMNIQVEFDKDFIPIVETQTDYYGLSAGIYRPIFVYNQEDKYKEIIKEIAQIKQEEKDFTSFKILNKELNNISTNTPFGIATTINSPNLLSKAGNTYIFKLGDIIGPQAEMYKAETRIAPLDIQYTHRLVRHIKVQIPDGYEIKNPESIVINKKYKDYGFISSYKIENNILLVEIDEYYDALSMPKNQIDDFRAVINAAADFNKVALVLVKK